jgi:hypothetical protein
MDGRRGNDDRAFAVIGSAGGVQVLLLDGGGGTGALGGSLALGGGNGGAAPLAPAGLGVLRVGVQFLVAVVVTASIAVGIVLIVLVCVVLAACTPALSVGAWETAIEFKNAPRLARRLGLGSSASESSSTSTTSSSSESVSARARWAEARRGRPIAAQISGGCVCLGRLGEYYDKGTM